MAKVKIEINQAGFDELTTEIINTIAVPAMEGVAAAANAAAGLADGYRVSVEGGNPLQKRDYRATVITATGAAMLDNAKNNTLVRNFGAAGGA